MSGKREKTGNIGAKAGNVHDKASLGEKDKLIDELKSRVEFLEKKLQSGQEELHVRKDKYEEQSHERERIVRALRESEERLRLAQQVASIGTFEWNIQTGVNTWTPELEAMYGLQPGEFPGTQGAWEQLVHPEDRPEAVRRVKESMEKGGFEGEWRVVWPDGTVHWLHGRAYVFKDNAGKPLKLIGVNIDITERKRLEEEYRRGWDELEAKVEQRTKELRVSERYLENIFEGIQEGISILDMDMNIVKVNRAMENWYSHMLPLEGKKCYQAFHGRFGACENCPSLRAMREKTMQTGIVPYVGQSGLAGWMELYSFPLMDDQGNVIGVIEHVRDITERKRAEEALKNSEAKSRALFENAGAAIFIADGATGEIIDCNQTAENLIGRSRREIIGLHQTQLHPTDKAEEYRKMFVGHLSKTCINNYEAEVQHKDGRIIPVMINGAALKINDREIIIGVFLDITGRKRAEEGLKEAKAQAELYLDLMGHDIRNMNMIGMGFLELALGSPDISKKDKDLLLMSLGSLENSTRLIENVRKLQKARSGELKHHTVDACQTFMRVLAHYSNMPDVNASFNLDLPPSCPVMANELLYEVFKNIVGNAIKHGGPEPFVDIKFDQVAADGRTYNSFIVEDNGPGIPDAIKDRIFNRLQRGDTKAKGMGLGLYLVKSLVESYGGRVCVEDRIAGDHTKGTRFVVILPAVDK